MLPLYFLITTVGNIKTYKEKSTEKIDGVVETIKVLDRAIRCAMITVLRSMIAVAVVHLTLQNQLNLKSFCTIVHLHEFFASLCYKNSADDNHLYSKSG